MITEFRDISGVYIKFEVHISPPPFLIYTFSPTEIDSNEGVRAACEKFSALFCNFVYFKSIGEKYAYFLPIGEKICISPLFYPLSIIFFPQPVIFPYFSPGGGGQTEKYTPLRYFGSI